MDKWLFDAVDTVQNNKMDMNAASRVSGWENEWKIMIVQTKL